MFEFHKWPSIEGFRSVAHNNADVGTVLYRGKIKLHGTNAAIQFKHGDVVAQSRSRFIDPDDDNIGFAQWIEDQKHRICTGPDCTLFGEWCGPGVQRGVAISQIDRKIIDYRAQQRLGGVEGKEGAGNCR